MTRYICITRRLDGNPGETVFLSDDVPSAESLLKEGLKLVSYAGANFDTAPDVLRAWNIINATCGSSIEEGFVILLSTVWAHARTFEKNNPSK